MFSLRTLVRSSRSIAAIPRIQSVVCRTFLTSSPRFNITIVNQSADEKKLILDSDLIPGTEPVTIQITAEESVTLPETTDLTLADLKATGKFSDKLLAALDKAKFRTLTPVQSKSLLPILEEEKGLVVRAKTGTGKTLAFVIPTLQNIIDEQFKTRKSGKGKISTLVIAPTRDLAMQIEGEYKKVIAELPEDLKRKTKINLLMGGKKTEVDFRYPPSIIIATPGRLEDKLSNPKFAKAFADINYRIYDEADRILDVGFKDSLDNIDRMLKEARQLNHPDSAPFKSILFSATIDKSVDEFARAQIHPTYNYINCVEENEGEAHENIHQTLVKTTDTIDSYQTALSFISENMQKPDFKAIVFLPTITATEWFFSVLKSARNNEVYDPIVHKKFGSKILKLNGKMSQSARDNSVRHFRQVSHGILICTDVAARGLDFNDVSHVIQLAPSPSVADYIHKIGRTARAGAKGKAVIFLTKSELKFKRILEKQRGIAFAEEIESSEIQQIEQVFDKIGVDEEEVENFIRTFLGFQKQVAAVFRLDFESMVVDVIKLYRILIKDPEARLFVTKNFVTQILAIDFRLAEQYFEVPGGFGKMNNNRGAKRGTFSGSRDGGYRGGSSRSSGGYGGNRSSSGGYNGSRSSSGGYGNRSYGGNRSEGYENKSRDYSSSYSRDSNSARGPRKSYDNKPRRDGSEFRSYKKPYEDKY